jgi:hypothetical protein
VRNREVRARDKDHAGRPFAVRAITAGLHATGKG